MAKCKAKAKRTGKRCKNNPVDGMEVCRMHGGKSLKGIAHPSFKHGRYSKHLPGGKQALFQELSADQDILSLDENISLIDVRLIELIQSLAEGGNPAELWKKASRAWDLMWRATMRADENAVAKHRDEIEAMLRDGLGDTTTWEEIDRISITRMRLTDTEMKRREKMKYMILAEDAMADYRKVGIEIRKAIDGASIPDVVKNKILMRIMDGLEKVWSLGINPRAGNDAIEDHDGQVGSKL